MTNNYVYVAIVLDEDTRAPKCVEVFKDYDKAQDFLARNGSFNMPCKREVRGAYT